MVFSHASFQVHAAPKRRAKDKVESEEMVPKTWVDKAKDTLGDVLANAAKARTAAIKLNSVEYASELAQQLMTNASELEKLYADLQGAVKNTTPDEAVLKKLVEQIDDASAFAAKAHAWFSVWY